MLLILHTHGKGVVNTQTGGRVRCPAIALPTALDLPRVPKPLLVLRCLLPALVARARPDQVHVGTKAPAGFARVRAGAAGAEAKVLRRDLFRCTGQFRKQIAALIPDDALCPRAGLGYPPEAFPFTHAPGPLQRQYGGRQVSSQEVLSWGKE